MDDRQKLIDELQGKHREKHFKITNSIGVGDIFRMLRANGFEGIGKPVEVKLFHKVIRIVDDHLAEELKNGKPVQFPSRMGHLEIRKKECSASYKDGRLKITYPVDWKSTIDLWLEDEEARKEKILIRFEDRFVYKVQYDKYNSNFNNKDYYSFEVNRFIKRALTNKIKKGEIDTLW